jgi:hypothetical protein
MQVLNTSVEKIQGQIFHTVIILYSNNNAYKRFYNLKGQHIDSKLVKPDVLKRLFKH